MAEAPGSWQGCAPAQEDEVAREAEANLPGAVEARGAKLGRDWDPGWDEKKGPRAAAASPTAGTRVEEQFLHLTIRKQVSYR